MTFDDFDSFKKKVYNRVEEAVEKISKDVETEESYRRFWRCGVEFGVKLALMSLMFELCKRNDYKEYRDGGFV